MTLVKICGITNKDDAMAAVDAGADMLGFIFAPSPREIQPGNAARIIELLPADVKTVGVFVDDTSRVCDITDMCGLSYVQLHGSQSEEFAAQFEAGRVIRAMRVKDQASIDSLAGYNHAAYYLLDSYIAGKAGGTGHTFDWTLANDAGCFGKPIILAGGLNPENVAEAIHQVRPFGVDVSSGLESSPGKKDHQKIKELMKNVRSVDCSA